MDKKYKLVECVDCKQPFEKRGTRQYRCPSCQKMVNTYRNRQCKRKKYIKDRLNNDVDKLIAYCQDAQKEE